MEYSKLFTNIQQAQRLMNLGISKYTFDFSNGGYYIRLENLLDMVPDRINMRMTLFCPASKHWGDWCELPHPINIEDAMMQICKCDGCYLVSTFLYEYESVLPGQYPASTSLVEAVVRFIELLLINGVKLKDIRNSTSS